MPAVVNDVVAQDAQISQLVELHVARLDAPYLCDARADFLVPVGEHKNDDGPACLLLVKPRFPIGRHEIICLDDAVMDDIRRTWVIDAGIDNDRAPVLVSPAGRLLHAGLLALDANLVALKT